MSLSTAPSRICNLRVLTDSFAPLIWFAVAQTRRWCQPISSSSSMAAISDGGQWTMMAEIGHRVVYAVRVKPAFLGDTKAATSCPSCIRSAGSMALMSTSVSAGLVIRGKRLERALTSIYGMSVMLRPRAIAPRHGLADDDVTDGLLAALDGIV